MIAWSNILFAQHLGFQELAAAHSIVTTCRSVVVGPSVVLSPVAHCLARSSRAFKGGFTLELCVGNSGALYEIVHSGLRLCLRRSREWAVDETFDCWATAWAQHG